MPDAITTALSRVHVSAEDAQRMSEWAAAAEVRPYRVQDTGAAQRPRPPFPARLADSLENFAARLGASGALMVSGMPVPDALPPTPDRPYPQIRRQLGTEPLLMGVAGVLGELLSYADWHDGDLVQNLYPLRSEAGRQNASNAVVLEMHTETAFRPNTPDTLVLLCLRSDSGAVTFVCDIDAACASLTPEQLRALTEPAFGFSLPEGGLTRPLPIVADTDGGRRYHYAEALVAHDSEHAPALEALRSTLDTTAVQVILGVGDMLVLDNRHMVHGRTGYRPRYDGTDRWLQRALIRVPPVTR